MNNITPLPAAFNFNNEVNKATKYIWPTVLILEMLTNTINIAVLSRRNLRSSACTHYFLALAVGNLLYMCFTPLQASLTALFSISLGSSQASLNPLFSTLLSTSPFGCRVSQFCIFSPSLLATTMLVCSSIDRFCASSSSPRLRRFSDVRIAQRVIIIVSIVIVIYMSPFIVISYWDYDRSLCSQHSTTFASIYLSSRILLYSIVEPFIMTIFGLLTIRNVRSRTNRMIPIAAQDRRRRTENQLTAVLLLQVGVYLVFSLPSTVIYLISLFAPSTATPMFMGFRTLGIIWLQAIFFLSFSLYILSANVFRAELLKMFRLYRGNNRLHPINQTIARKNNTTGT